MPAYWDKLILLMVIKVVYAVFVGFLLDFVLCKALPRSLRGGYTGHADEVDCHEEHSDEEGHPQPIWKAALRHTLEIFVFIFVFSLVFGLIVEGVGEDVFASVLGQMCIRDRREVVEHIALVFVLVQTLFEQPAARGLVLLHPGIMEMCIRDRRVTARRGPFSSGMAIQFTSFA